MSYPFSSITINDKIVTIENIVSGQAIGSTEFEINTFEFMRAWLTGKRQFTINTSGSTGAPKEIVVMREQMTASALLTQQAIDLKENFTALLCIDPRYIGGKMMIVRSLVIGMKLIAVEPSANPFVNLPPNQCVDFTALVPYQVTSILGSKHPQSLNKVNKVIVGGAPLNEEAIAQLKSHETNFYATYGMTETISHIALQKLNGPNQQKYFQCLPGVSVKQDSRGCLVINAAYLSDTIVTNDLVDLLAADKFIWNGRYDNVINSAGVKVIPEKVEAVIKKIFAGLNVQSRFFMHGVADQRLGQKVLLVIEGGNHSAEILTLALTKLRQEVSSPYEIPKEVWSCNEFIMTESGKINRLHSLQKSTLLLAVKK